MAEELLQHINSLLDLAPEDLPESSCFLLEIDFSELSTYHLETQKYWTLAVDAALKANAFKYAQGQRAKRVWQKLNTKIPSRKKLGIAIIEHQICQDGMHVEVPPDILWTTNCHQPPLDRLIKRRPHTASIIASL
jgi:hypothetical protein